MAESMVQRPAVENKMGDSAVASSASLEVSVSFGKFDPDSLSWEKWSTFSPNKYLDEVGKCSTPGSVAQKKAYFEAHYKKIAARKIEKMEQERLMESENSDSREPDFKRPAEIGSPADGEGGMLANGASDKGFEEDVNEKLKFALIEEEKEHDVISVDSQEQSSGTSVNNEVDVETIKEEPESGSRHVEVGVELRSPEEEEEVTVVEVDDLSVKTSPDVVEQPLKVDNEVKKTPLSNKKSPKLHTRNIAKKTTPSRVEKAVLGSRKPAVSPATKSSAVTKASQLSAPRLSKSTMSLSKSSNGPVSRPSAKVVSGSPSFPKAKSSTGQKRSELPTSLHMSMNLDPVSSSPSHPTMRKSLIMESMGDKDIVRRAFKTFQTSLNGLRYSNDGITSSPQQVPMKKASSNLTPRKENEGPKKSVEKTVQRGRSAATSSSMSSWSAKGSGIEKRNTGVVSSPASIMTDTRAERWKEKPGEKSFSKEAEGSHIHAKTKVTSGNQMKNLGQGLKPRSTSSLSVSRGHGTAKITLDKNDKCKVNRRLAKE